MDTPRHFDLAAGYAVFRPVGEMHLAEVAEEVTGAISFAREKGVGRLLVVLTSVTGIQPPKLTPLYRFVRDWARASAGLVRVAVVTNADMMDPARFGVTVATNAGMSADVFEDEAAAVAWLVE